MDFASQLDTLINQAQTSMNVGSLEYVTFITKIQPKLWEGLNRKNIGLVKLKCRYLSKCQCIRVISLRS